MAVIDALGSDEEVGVEQAELDRHDEEITELTMRLQTLSAPTPTPTITEQGRAMAEVQLAQLQAKLTAVNTDIDGLTADPGDVPLVCVYQEHLMEYKRELSDIRNNVLTITVDQSDPLNGSIKRQEKQLFDMSIAVKRLLYKPSTTPEALVPTTPGTRGVNLPKIGIATFNGDMLEWQTFWEQFEVSVHNRRDITTAEKLAYLRHSLKDGSAKSVIEGLSQSGDQYAEAIASLKGRYNRPRLIHQTHVQKICEAPNLKDGSGKELRRLHDTVQQHLRALKAMDQDPSGAFITSMIELKLDSTTMFEWHRASQATTGIPHYKDILAFLNLRAQAAETCPMQKRRYVRNEQQRGPKNHSHRVIPAHVGNIYETNYASTCVVCKSEKHPLYICPKFKALPHDKMLSTVRTNSLCLNCLRTGHMAKNCTSLHRCKKCQKPHHTLLHTDTKAPLTETLSGSTPKENEQSHTASVLSANAPSGSSSNTLLMTCQVLIHAPDGSQIRARGLLDSGSSTSFVSQRLVQSLGLQKVSKNLEITGIAGISHNSPLHSISTFHISTTFSPSERMSVTAVVVPKVTCDLPVTPIPFSSKWEHLSNLNLSDPDFGRPGRINLLLGIETYTDTLLQGRRKGPVGSTYPGWVLAGKTNKSPSSPDKITNYHAIVTSDDDILRKFWELEENPKAECNLSPQERTVVDHFNERHTRKQDGRFVVPLPKDPHAKPIGESRSQAVRRFLSLERSLHSKGQFTQFAAVMEEYVDMGHAEIVPVTDLQKPNKDIFYVPMHAVYKEHSTTTKIRAVFDASAKSSTGVSLNDTLLVGPTVHPPLIDVLLRFRLHKIALTADVSKMYRAIELAQPDRDLHRFVWRSKPNKPLVDYRMTRVTFGVSASPFAANMSLKQTAIDHAAQFPQATNVVTSSFYVDDCLTGANSIEESLKLQQQLHDLFTRGGFLLRKWNSSNATVLQNIPPELRDSQQSQLLPTADEYTKTLGIKWNARKDHFRLTVAEPPPVETLTKRALVSDIAKTFDILGWFSPATIKVKILLQKVWEEKVDWDDPVPEHIKDTWSKWRAELPYLSHKLIPRCYFDTSTQISSIQLHGFSDASESAYAAVVYLRLTDSSGCHQISLVISKTKVAPIKRLSIPRLELCGAHLLAGLLHHVKQVFSIPLSNIYASTDSTVVLNWLDGSPKRFKTYVGNRISAILDLTPPDTADCASRGLYPMLNYPLWWNGPDWLKQDQANWPKQDKLTSNSQADEGAEISLVVVQTNPSPVIPFDQFSNFNHLKRITCWILRFVKNCKTNNSQEEILTPLTALELQQAENYWIRVVQTSYFQAEIEHLNNKQQTPKASSLIPLNPFVDDNKLLRVGGRRQLSTTTYSSKHPLILHGKHNLTHPIIYTEHLRLLHAGPTLLAASLNRRYHIMGGMKIIRSITRKCVTCRKLAARPQPQKLGQLPIERVTPDSVFDKVGIDYAGPVSIKYGHVRKPKIVYRYP